MSTGGDGVVMFGDLVVAIGPGEGETAIVVGGGFPEDGVTPRVRLGVEKVLKLLLEGG